MSLLPVEPAWRLAERAEEHRWLVTGLWSEQAVGIVGGEPKCCKSFLALDIAVAVAAGIPCLRRFAVPRAGPRPALRRRGRAAHRATTASKASARPPASRSPISTSRSSPRPSSGSISMPIAAASPRPSPAAAAPAHPRSLRAPAPHRRERQRRGRAAARLSARAAASPWRRRARRPSCQEGRRQRSRRPGPARLIRVPRLGRFQPLSAPQRR